MGYWPSVTLRGTKPTECPYGGGATGAIPADVDRGSGRPRADYGTTNAVTSVSPRFGLRHTPGMLPRSIGGAPPPYGRLAGLLGRVLMLRASRREDRKRVPRYSSLQLPYGSAGADVRESFGKRGCGTGQELGWIP
ncbi:hypothetical protein OK074_3772 [Actinobacteria bacterium OK074]|nr:hypothetical protein OK074_3772 [Actinobacteria bacterium OK074]